MLAGPPQPVTEAQSESNAPRATEVQSGLPAKARRHFRRASSSGPSSQRLKGASAMLVIAVDVVIFAAEVCGPVPSVTCDTSTEHTAYRAVAMGVQVRATGPV